MVEMVVLVEMVAQVAVLDLEELPEYNIWGGRVMDTALDTVVLPVVAPLFLAAPAPGVQAAGLAVAVAVVQELLTRAFRPVVLLVEPVGLQVGVVVEPGQIVLHLDPVEVLPPLKERVVGAVVGLEPATHKPPVVEVLEEAEVPQETQEMPVTQEMPLPPKQLTTACLSRAVQTIQLLPVVERL